MGYFKEIYSFQHEFQRGGYQHFPGSNCVCVWGGGGGVRLLIPKETHRTRVIAKAPALLAYALKTTVDCVPTCPSLLNVLMF